MRRLFALGCRRNEIALEAQGSFHSRPRAALCLSARRELRLPCVNMSARIFRSRFRGRCSRRAATFIEAGPESPRIKLICRLARCASSCTLALRLAFPHAPSRSSPPANTGICFSTTGYTRPGAIRNTPSFPPRQPSSEPQNARILAKFNRHADLRGSRLTSAALDFSLLHRCNMPSIRLHFTLLSRHRTSQCALCLYTLLICTFVSVVGIERRTRCYRERRS